MIRGTPEMRRVLSLPVTAERRSVDDLKRPGCRRDLWPIQRQTLETLRAATHPVGALGMIDVGEGKSLIALLAAGAAFRSRPVILTERPLVSQMWRDYHDWSADYHIVRPEILSYHEVSQQRNAMRLHELDPDIIICDEAHGLKAYPSMSGRSKRVWDYLYHNQDCIFVAMSGSFADTTIPHYPHLAEWALREDAPLPRDPHEADVWASVIDPEKENSKEERNQLEPLRKWAGHPNTRVAYQKRLRSAPGVVVNTAKGPRVGASLRIEPVRVTTPTIKEALDRLGKLWELPDGTMLVDSTEFARHARTISMGFYNDHQIHGDPQDVQVWRERRRAWNAALRQAVLYHSQPGRDTPGLWERATRQGAASGQMQTLLAAWDDIRDKCHTTSTPVWVDRTPLNALARHAKAIGALVWYESAAVESALCSLGFVCHGAGSTAPKISGRPTAVSAHVHRKGWDGGQKLWRTQIVLEPGPSAKKWEQLLGRLHRPGQTAPVVRTLVNQSTIFQRRALDRAIFRSHWVQDSHGTKRKLCYADFANVKDIK